MKTSNLSALIFLGLAACGAASTSATPPSTTAEEGESRTVCSIRNLPDGWVVVAHGTYPLCPQGGFSADSWNSYTIEQAGDVATVCSDSPIPGGYIKRNPVRSVECIIPMFTSMDYTNAFVIEKL